MPYRSSHSKEHFASNITISCDRVYHEWEGQPLEIEALKESPKPVKYLQMLTGYSSRGHFLKDVINPLLESGTIYRDGCPKSPTARLHLR